MVNYFVGLGGYHHHFNANALILMRALGRGQPGVLFISGDDS